MMISPQSMGCGNCFGMVGLTASETMALSSVNEEIGLMSQVGKKS
jgi:hypothetical protein